MPFQKVALRPGVNADFTPTLNEGGWSVANLIRFKDGQAQKRGGWQRLSQQTFVGSVRGLHAWADLAGNPYLVGGSEQRLGVFTNGNIVDITPIRATHNVAVNFSTVINTPTVTTVDAGHGAAIGDWVDIVAVVSVGGLLLQGFYQVASVVDNNTYTITATSNATGTVNNGGAVPLFNTTMGSPNVSVTLNNHGLAANQLFNVTISTTVGGIVMVGTFVVQSVTNANVFVIAPGPNAGATTSGSENAGNAQFQYLVPTGFASATFASGYGVGIYGSGLYGTGSGVVLKPLRQWFLDNFGQNAIGNYSGSTLYQWVPPATTFAGTMIATNPASAVTNAPAAMTASFVSNPQQMVIALGAETSGTTDPNLVRWCDAGGITIWTASATNQAGSFRIPTGSRIIGGLVGPNQNLIWTDLDLWSMQYVGLPFVWSFNKIANECGLIGARAMGILAQQVLWMGVDNFFVAGSGGVNVVPCPVWDFVFKNINPQQTDKIHCAVNSLFQEVEWYFPSASGSGEIDSYVKYNALEKTWDTGSLPRLSWIDENVLGQPIGIDPTGLMFQHDIPGVYDADGLPMLESIQTGYFDLGDGEAFVFVERLIPDFTMTGPAPQLQITAYFLEYPNDANSGVGPITAGPYTITNKSQIIIVRTRSRQAALKIQGIGLGTFWRLGAIRHNGQADGRR